MKVSYTLRWVVYVIFFVGSAFFYVHKEGWNYLDSFIFIVTTITTVGYGYRTPEDDWSRLFTIFVILFGVIAVFTTLTDFANEYVDKTRKYFVQSVHLGGPYLESITFSLGTLVIVIFTGAVVICYNESRDFIKSLLYAIETASTVGYGSLPIKYRSTKVFLLFYIVTAVVLSAIAIKNISSQWSKYHLDKRKAEIFNNTADFTAMADAFRDLENEHGFVATHQPGHVHYHKDNNKNSHNGHNGHNGHSDGHSDGHRNNRDVHNNHSADHNHQPIGHARNHNNSVNISQTRNSLPDQHCPERDVESGTTFEVVVETGVDAAVPLVRKVTKYQFVSGALLYLHKLDVEMDCIPWFKKFRDLDVNENGYLTKQELTTIHVESKDEMLTMPPSLSMHQLHGLG